MKFSMGKKGAINIGRQTDNLVQLAVFFFLAAALLPVVANALGNISVLNIPLASLFGSQGLVMTLIVVGLVVLAIRATGIGGRSR